jgi:hypothetical protein
MNPSIVNETPVLPDVEDDDGHGARRDGLTRTTRIALARRHVGRRPSDRALAGRLLTFPSRASINASLALRRAYLITWKAGTETGRPQAIAERTAAPEIDGRPGGLLGQVEGEMGRQPCCDKLAVKKGPWTAEEDQKLVGFLLTHGHCCWRVVPKLAGE